MTTTVQAEIGKRFLDFLKAGEQTAERMDTLTAAAEEQGQRLIEEAQTRLSEIANAQGQIEKAQQTSENLAELLDRAERLVPNLDSIGAAAPDTLIRELNEAHDPAQVFVIVDHLLELPNTSSKQLEIAGDQVRKTTQDIERARRLYEGALERDPSNISVQAELVALDLSGGTEEQQEGARDRLRQLALDHPDTRTALVKLMNHLVDKDDYRRMEKVVRELLDKNPDNPMLWRNLAVALTYTSKDPTEIREAYQRSMDLAGLTPTGDNDVVNTAKSFAGYLVHQRDFERAEQVINEALLAMPFEDNLYLATYQLEIARGDIDRARRALHMMGELGGPAEQHLAERYLRGLAAMQFVQEGSEMDLVGDEDPSM